nr:YncE family protein [Granulicella rosea]
MLPLAACRRSGFPDIPAGFREFAYVANSGGNTVSVLDLVYLRQDRVLQVGAEPTALAVNGHRDEVYVVNTQTRQTSGSISVVDTTKNRIAATIPVNRQPVAIAVDSSGRRAFVVNSGSNNISVLDLDQRRQIAVASTGEQPGVVRIAANGRTLIVTNRGSGSVSIYDAALPPEPDAKPTGKADPPLKLRATFGNCPGASDAAILPDDSRAFVACSGGHQVMGIALAQAPDSWAVKQDSAALTDHLLAFLDVGQQPEHIAMKPNGGEIFVSNTLSDSVSEISTYTCEVGGTYPIGSRPAHGVVSDDNSTLWVSNSGADAIGLYSIEDGKLVSSLHTGSSPDSLAFSADEHLLLAADQHSGDVAVIRTQGKLGPALFTMLPAGQAPSAIVTKAMTDGGH